MKVVVVVPALNEAGNIGPLVHDCLSQGIPTVVVVDNGSTDATAQNATSAGAVVVPEPRRGYGYACAAGSAKALQIGADVVVYIDADHSSRPDEIKRLVAPVQQGQALLVLGSRVKGTIQAGAMPPHQRFGNWLSARLMRSLYNVDVTDLGPYRAIDAGLLADLDMSEMTFGWPTEMMVKAVNAKAVMVEVPATWVARHEGRSKVSGTLVGSVKAAWYILGVTMRGRTAKMQLPEFERTW